MRVQQLNALYPELKERGGAGGGPLAVATVRGIHAVLHKALNDAAKQDLVTFDVASRATLPKRDVHLDQPQRRGSRAEAEDVDLDGLAIYVRRTLGCTQKRAYLKAPKTNRPRTINALTPFPRPIRPSDQQVIGDQGRPLARRVGAAPRPNCARGSSAPCPTAGRALLRG